MYRRQTGLAIVFCIGTWLAPACAQYVTDVPYHHQLFNSINPTGSCQNTTIAITSEHRFSWMPAGQRERIVHASLVFWK